MSDAVAPAFMAELFTTTRVLDVWSSSIKMGATIGMDDIMPDELVLVKAMERGAGDLVAAVCAARNPAKRRTTKEVA